MAAAAAADVNSYDKTGSCCTFRFCNPDAILHRTACCLRVVVLTLVWTYNVLFTPTKRVEPNRKYLPNQRRYRSFYKCVYEHIHKNVTSVNFELYVIYTITVQRSTVFFYNISLITFEWCKQFSAQVNALESVTAIPISSWRAAGLSLYWIID